MPAGKRVKAQFLALLEYFQEAARNRQEDKKQMRYKQKDNDLFDISRDSCSDVFSWVLKSVWPISPVISSRRTFTPCFTSSYAASIEASYVQILEAEWNSGEDCKWTAEVGLTKGGTPIERWWTRNWYKKPEKL